MSGAFFGPKFSWGGEKYGDGRHPDLPWGYWLTSSGDVHGEPPLVDEQGRQWGSVREAFWSGRLGFPNVHYRWVDAVLGFMLSFLAIHDGRFVAREERIRDIFLGDGHLSEFFFAFMIAAGFIESSQQLTPEGRAVLMMLIATRSQDEAQDDVGLDWIGANRGFIPHHRRRNAADMVEEREIVASRMRNRFTADHIDGCPVVKLVSFKITEQIPLRSTIWSMSWDDGERFARDCFYLWLVERIDRWDDWTMMVEKQGTRALTEHLMKLSFSDHISRASS